MRSYRPIPDVPVGYALNPQWSWFSIIVPEATTNLVANPSVETGTTGYAAVGGSIARSTTQQRRGAYSLAVTPTAAAGDGVRYDTVGLTSGTTYTFGVDVRGAAGVSYKIYFADLSGNALGSAYTFVGTGRWQRVAVTYASQSSANYRVYVAKAGGTSTAVFYVDGLQVEGRAYATTYCDGDLVGLVPGQVPAPFLWTGAPHASTSTRSAQTRAGGKVVNFKRFGFQVVAYVALGMAAVTNVTTSYGQIDGEAYDDTVYPERTIAISGVLDAATHQQLQRLRSDLYDAVKRDAVAVRQPLVLRYQMHDGLTPIGDECEIVCSYQSGLDGNTDGHHQERITAQFRMHLPLIYGAGDAGALLDVQNDLTAGTGRILQRSPTGAWANMGTGLNATSLTQVYGPDGYLYVGGGFTLAGGVADTAYIARWTGTAWEPLGTGMNGAVYGIAFGADGKLYAVGQFTTAGGVGANRVAVWDGSTWAALGTGLNGDAYGVAVGPDGAVYVVGAFTTAGGGAAVRAAKWNGSAWSALSSGLNGNGWVARFGPDGYLYAGGEFTTAGGTTVNRIARWNGSAWSALSSGADAVIYAIVFGADGTLYAGGDYGTIGGITAAAVAKWNGVAWSALGAGVIGTVRALALGPDSHVYAAGALSTVGTVTSPVGVGRWNGSSWVPIDAQSNVGLSAITLSVSKAGALTVGWTTATGVFAGEVTTVTNEGTASAYPRLTIKGPSSGTSRIYQLVNYTTGRAIYLNYSIAAGETAVLDLTPNKVSFTSDFQGNILGKVLPGSTLDWFLQPRDNVQTGANIVGIFAADSSNATSTVVATVQWRPTYNSVDDLTP